jgi:hypothetical protein
MYFLEDMEKAGGQVAGVRFGMCWWTFTWFQVLYRGSSIKIGFLFYANGACVKQYHMGRKMRVRRFLLHPPLLHNNLIRPQARWRVIILLLYNGHNCVKHRELVNCWG